MELKIGEHYIHKDKAHPNLDVVITRIYHKSDDSVRFSAPEGNTYLNDMVERAKASERENIYVTAEYVFRDGSFDTTKHAFESMFQQSRGQMNPFDEHSKKLIESMFETFIAGVYSSGGDGGGQLRTKYYDFRVIADMFGEYGVKHYNQDGVTTKTVKIKDIYTRIDADDHVTFTDMSNENFVIGPAFPSSKAHMFDDVFIVF